MAALSPVLIVTSQAFTRDALFAALRQDWAPRCVSPHEIQLDASAGVSVAVIAEHAFTEPLTRLHAARPGLPILVVTGQALRSVGVEAIRLGALGVLARQHALSDLNDALATVLAGRRYVPPALARALAEYAAGGDTSRPLTTRQRQVVLAIAQGHTRDEISSRLALSRASVDTYRLRALRRLAVRTDADLTRYAIREGWLDAWDDASSLLSAQW